MFLMVLAAWFGCPPKTLNGVLALFGAMAFWRVDGAEPICRNRGDL